MKKFLAALLTLAMALSLVACGGGSDTQEPAGEDGGEGTGEETQTVGFVSASWSDDYCKRLNDALVELGPQ